MVKVITTSASIKYNKGISEFGGVVKEGEIFSVSEERYKILAGENRFNLVFVKKYDGEPEPITLLDNIPISSIEETPEIFIVEPNNKPIQVDENLKPIKKKTKKKQS